MLRICYKITTLQTTEHYKYKVEKVLPSLLCVSADVYFGGGSPASSFSLMGVSRLEFMSSLFETRVGTVARVRGRTT